MSLKAIVSEVPEGLEDHYTAGTDANEGKFILSVESVEGFGLEDVNGLKKTMNDWKEKANTSRATLEGFGEYTPDSIAELALQAKSAGNPSEALESLKAEYSGKLTESQSTILSLQKTIKDNAHRNTIDNVFASRAGMFKEEFTDFAKGIFSSYIGTHDNGKAFILNDDKTGARMSDKQGQYNNEMDVDEWVSGVNSAVLSGGSFVGISSKDLKSMGAMMASNAKTGSGAGSPKAPQAGAMSSEKWAKMTITERTAHVKNGGDIPE